MKMALRHIVPVVFNTMLLFNPVKALADGNTDRVCLDFFFSKSDSVFNPENIRNHAPLDSLKSKLNRYDIFKDVVISGYTSPEGDINYNSRLARARANSLYKYILQFPMLASGNIAIMAGKNDSYDLSTISDEEMEDLEVKVYPLMRRAELSFRCLEPAVESELSENSKSQFKDNSESFNLTDNQQITPPRMAVFQTRFIPLI